MTAVTLTPRQGDVLRVLHERGPLSVVEIAAAVGTSRQSIRSTLLSLSSKGLVKRENLDGRQGVRWEQT